MKIRDKVLIVEDEQNIKNFMSTILAANGFDTLMAGSAKEALSMISSHCPDLIILDLGLPDMDGMEVLKQVRAWSSVPVIVVSARTHEGDKVAALDLGADDYIEKPFSPSVLVARVKAHLAQYHRLKPQTAAAPKLLTVGPLSADPAQHCIRKNDAELALKNKEYELLLFLMRHPGQVFSREDLYEMIWGLESMGDNITVAVHMNRLREKIEDDPSHPTLLQTVWGVGYRLNKGER